jgi:hypothetical protein
MYPYAGSLDRSRFSESAILCTIPYYSNRFPKVRFYLISAWNNYPRLKVLLGLLFLLLAVSIIVMTFIYRKHLQLCGVLIKYATRFLADSFCVYFYIPMFLIMTIGLITLCVWQYVAFSTAYPPFRVQDDIYWRASGSTFFQVLNVIELIWGLQFLRDSCKYMLTQSTLSSQVTLSNGISLTGPLIVRLHSNDSSKDTSAV